MPRPEKNFDDQPSGETTPLASKPEKAPFSGFFPRLGAFLIDCVALYFIFNALDLMLHSQLLDLNPALPYLAFILGFVYFWIGAGPLAQGRTLGKMLLSLRVTAPDGQPLSWSAAFRRTLLQFPVFFILAVSHIPYGLIFPGSALFAIIVLCNLIALAALVYLIVLALGTAIHPLKQGWHDLWAPAYVTSRETAEAFRAALAVASQDMLIERRAAVMKRVSMIFWALATVVILIMATQGLTKPDFKVKFQPLLEAQKGFTLPHYQVSDVILPIFPANALKDFTPERLMDEISRVRTEIRSQGKTVPTTQTMIAQLQTIVVRVVRTHGALPAGEIDQRTFRTAMENLRAAVWRGWLANPDRKTTGTLNVASDYEAAVIEPSSMMMYHMVEYGTPKVRVHGPADPARGGLIFEHVLPSAPQSSEQPATPTATPTALPTHATPRP